MSSRITTTGQKYRYKYLDYWKPYLKALGVISATTAIHMLTKPQRRMLQKEYEYSKLTGEIAPLSKKAIDEFGRYIRELFTDSSTPTTTSPTSSTTDNLQGTIHILQLGAGRGGVSRQILEMIRLLKPKTVKVEYDIVEKHVELYPILEQIKSDFAQQPFKDVQPIDVNIFIDDWKDFQPDHKYQFILSTQSEQLMNVTELYEFYKKLIKMHDPRSCVISRIQYVLQLKWMIKFGKEGERLFNIGKLQYQFMNCLPNASTTKKTIWMNVPPVMVFHTLTTSGGENVDEENEEENLCFSQ